ncbi:hypothetical protein SASPL_106364 [Salvia splendens]|uniref:Protein Mpv17 n=1 Tax=Salvia splendens TaxID=180675 RepID=A0A8X8YKV0_SALSN|nr:hypothetical protein SASPL_106364 [Salvia splendens]
MRFHFANDSIGHTLRRRFAATYNQQCRAYAPFRRPLNFTKKPSLPESSNRISLSIFRRFCSSKSSGSRMGLLGWYLGMLESRPILTKSLSSGLIYAAADTTSQAIIFTFDFTNFSLRNSFNLSYGDRTIDFRVRVRTSKKLFTMDPNGAWDPIRTLRIAGFGLFMLGPSQHYWFNFVARVLPNRDMISTLKKLAMGQIAYSPVINGIFFSYNAAAQVEEQNTDANAGILVLENLYMTVFPCLGENGNEIAARLKRDLFPTLLNGLMYWPMCDFLTYRVVPVHLQPLMNSSCAFLWSIYLTYMASLEKAVPT